MWILFLKSKTPCKYGLKKTQFSRSNVEFARLWDWNTSSTEVGNTICEVLGIYGPKQLMKTDTKKGKKTMFKCPRPKYMFFNSNLHHSSSGSLKSKTRFDHLHLFSFTIRHEYVRTCKYTYTCTNKLHVNMHLNFNRSMCKNIYMYIGIYI